MAVSIPPKLTLTQLEKLAFHCGISKTGTKSIVRQRLADTLAAYQPLPGSTRILSIDLGIRNLAYSLLVPASSKGKGTKNGRDERQPGSGVVTRPAVHVWQRQNLLPNTASRKGVIKNEEDIGPSGLAEDFTPASLSRIATNLVRDQLLPLKPTHVLIERQRFRSGGGPSVLEWTVRVNTLEAMLYAVFATLRSMKQWDGEIIPVEPRRVGPYLLTRAGMIQHADMSKKTKAENKKLKIDLLAGWLQREDEIEMANAQVRAMAEAYMHRLTKTSRNKKLADTPRGTELEGSTKLPKLDDLADSLLQGVAFLEWEGNKASMLKNGVEAFIDLHEI